MFAINGIVNVAGVLRCNRLAFGSSVSYWLPDVAAGLAAHLHGVPQDTQWTDGKIFRFVALNKPVCVD